ncbi:D-glycero-beta-D-manno-heptose-7-phosphate kinase [bacterium]|jgi:D-beta-D-heptose 7-phosphate kinase / D-beta-D-heptose 1-phosphate adenosyltransferase|nr:D-glycero-beta-D-manno-heptose-7-phosphate kinase [bacterium]
MLANLLKHLKDQSQKTIVVVGDVMLDEYHWCQANRLSPEAPVPVCRVNETTYVPGGAANVATNIQTMGANVRLIGCIGHESSGERLLEALSKEGVDTTGLIKTPNRPTTLKSRVIASGQHVVRLDREDNSPLNADLGTTIINQVKAQLSNTDAILLSDYAKGVLTDMVTDQLIQLASDANIPLIVDPKGYDYTRYKGAYCLTPNLKEFKAAVQSDVQTEEDIAKFGSQLINDCDLSSLVVTRSEKGMSVLRKDGNKTDIPTKAREVSDITGAGDTVIAGITLGLASGMTIEDAATWANYAAGVAVGKVGTSTVTLDEVEKAYIND